LLIQDGNTHYPSPKHKYRFFRGDLAMPPRIVMVDGSGNITLDAIDWLAEQKVDLVRTKWDGRISSVCATSGYAADTKKVAWQIAVRANNAQRLAFAGPLISEKIRATLFNLENLLPLSPSRDKAIEAAKGALVNLKAKPPNNISRLLALEGAVAQGYWFAWRALPIKWQAKTRYPIPEEWTRFFSRSSLKQDVHFGNRHATHPINAMLNYAYTVLEAKTRIQAVCDGYDPSIGILHHDMRADRHSFVFDAMEPQRPVVDRTILDLIGGETFSGGDFILQRDGVCRLNPDLARTIAATVAALLGQRAYCDLSVKELQRGH
jgi:CRISPR-associated protein Cas1